jgi:hypothetical protein
MSAVAARSVAGYIAGWQPSAAVPAEAAAFARQVVAGCGPLGRDRAKSLLWGASRLAAWTIPLGMEPVPEVLLHPSVIERFTAHAPGISGAARRTLRTNLRFVARRVVPYLDPADAPLPRGRAKAPYTAADIAGYLALAGAQPATGRRMRATALVCLGAGAGLIRSDLRNARGTDVTARSGGLVVEVRGTRPRVVPVLARTSPGWPRPPPSPAISSSPAAANPNGATSPTPSPGHWRAAAGCRRWTPAGCARPGWPSAPR